MFFFSCWATQRKSDGRREKRNANCCCSWAPAEMFLVGPRSELLFFNRKRFVTFLPSQLSFAFSDLPEHFWDIHMSRLGWECTINVERSQVVGRRIVVLMPHQLYNANHAGNSSKQTPSTTNSFYRPFQVEKVVFSGGVSEELDNKFTERTFTGLPLSFSVCWQVFFCRWIKRTNEGTKEPRNELS